MRVLVVGAGLAGISAAWYLSEYGAEVVVLERNQGPGLDASHANGALLHPSMAEPWNFPGVLGTVLRTLGRASAPMRIRARALPSLLSWGPRFIYHSKPAHFVAAARRNVLLALHSLELLDSLRESEGLDFDSYRRGALQVFRTPQSADKSAAWAEQIAEWGAESRCLTIAETLEMEPALRPVASTLVGSRHYRCEQGGDAYRYCCELEARLRRKGVEFHYGIACERLVVDDRRVAAVIDTAGAEWKADDYLLAGGSDSPVLLRSARLSVPILPVKGYSVTLPRTGTAVAPSVPLIDPDSHIAIVPLGADRVRVAGTAEFAGYDRSIDEARITSLLANLRTVLPGYASLIEPRDIVPWAGLRPMCVDGSPVIGPTSLCNLHLNTGHGQLGWTLAAGSGALVADLIMGRPPKVDARPYAPMRLLRRL